VKAGNIGPGAYVVCPVVDCGWKLNTDQEGATGTAHFTSPAQGMDDAIRAASFAKAAEIAALTKAHLTGEHPKIYADLLRTISTLNARLAAKDAGSGLDIRLDADQGNALYRWLEEADLMDTRTGENVLYRETPLAPLQQQLSAWLRRGGGWEAHSKGWEGTTPAPSDHARYQVTQPWPPPDPSVLGHLTDRYRSQVVGGGEQLGRVQVGTPHPDSGVNLGLRRARPESHDDAGSPGALPTVSADQSETGEPTGCGHHVGYHGDDRCQHPECRCTRGRPTITGSYCPRPPAVGATVRP
jgi:hypothetical protein